MSSEENVSRLSHTLYVICFRTKTNINYVKWKLPMSLNPNVGKEEEEEKNRGNRKGKRHPCGFAVCVCVFFFFIYWIDNEKTFVRLWNHIHHICKMDCKHSQVKTAECAQRASHSIDDGGLCHQ